MEPKFDTCFFERYAMCSLRSLLGKRYSHLVNADRPDLQDVAQGIGIEVTRAITEDRNVANSLMVVCAKLGAELGVAYTDDLLDRIFARFCVGK